MSIRDRILLLAMEAESDGKDALAAALYVVGGSIDPDGSNCPATAAFCQYAMGVGRALKLESRQGVPA